MKWGWARETRVMGVELRLERKLVAPWGWEALGKPLLQSGREPGTLPSRDSSLVLSLPTMTLGRSTP